MTGPLSPVPTFEAGRLRYRAPRMSDFEIYHAFCASDRAVPLGGPFPRRIDAFDRLAKLVGHWHLRGFGRWMVADRETDEPLGVVGLLHPEGWPETELAWTVFAGAEGRGIAFEAARFARAHAYDTLGLSTLVSYVKADNVRSAALARRMGAADEGVFDHPVIGAVTVWRHPSPDEAQR
jgi:ribosomal-protein-alanine N-acetyltransferase